MKAMPQATCTRPSPRRMRSRHDWRLRVGGWIWEVPKCILILAIRAYQLTLSPAQTFLFGAMAGCRNTPTCSVYAVEALREHGMAAGTLLAAKRICHCHPWGGCGHDPVPPKRRLEAGGRRPILEVQNSEVRI